MKHRSLTRRMSRDARSRIAQAMRNAKRNAWSEEEIDRLVVAFADGGSRAAHAAFPDRPFPSVSGAIRRYCLNAEAPRHYVAPVGRSRASCWSDPEFQRRFDALLTEAIYKDAAPTLIRARRRSVGMPPR